MNLETVFKNQKVMIPYFTFGDPDIETTKKLICHSFESGAECIELGIPFSDPIADGPVIQDSHYRALTNDPKISIMKALKCVKDVKRIHSKPIIFMAAVNLIIQFGVERFFQKAATYQLDGIIIPDLTVEASNQFVKLASQYNISLILLASHLCEPKRLKKIATASSGFVYLISSTGTTGERSSFSSSSKKVTAQIKKIKDIPVVIGFGVSQPEHLSQLYKYADGAIVGSHLVSLFSNPSQSIDNNIKAVGKRIKELSSIQ